MKDKLSVDRLKEVTVDMRYDILRMCHMCGTQNGHLGGCMSAVELLAVLYCHEMNIVEANCGNIAWDCRDRFVLSKGHAGIAMYAAMKHAGLISEEDILKGIRGDQTILFRHPKRNPEFGIECSCGSLGMGIGFGIGMAEAALRKGFNNKVYVMLGDGECDEGAVWEGAAYAGHRKLENLVVIIDKNGLQLDGPTSDVLGMDNMRERWEAFGFTSVEIDGHDIEQIISAFKISHVHKPLAIIANTVKGKGVSFAENRVEWHDNHLSNSLYEVALEEVLWNDDCLDGVRKLAEERYREKKTKSPCVGDISEVHLHFSDEACKRWNSIGVKNVVGDVAYELAKADKKFIMLCSDCANRIGVQKLKEEYPENFMEVGISEQNQIGIAAGLASEGFHVFAVAYAPFITARVLDQVRVNMGYMKLPIHLIGLTAGFAAGDLGATHTALEDIGNLRNIPNVEVYSPADPIEIAKTMEHARNINRPCYIRITANYRNEMIHVSDYSYIPERAEILSLGKDIAILSSGGILKEAMRAGKMLVQAGKTVLLCNMQVIKPLDTDAVNLAMKCKLIVTIEEHNHIGGLGSSVAEYMSEQEGHPRLVRIGVPDCFYTADVPNKLLENAGLDSDSIYKKIKDEYEKKVVSN